MQWYLSCVTAPSGQSLVNENRVVVNYDRFQCISMAKMVAVIFLPSPVLKSRLPKPHFQVSLRPHFSPKACYFQSLGRPNLTWYLCAFIFHQKHAYLKSRSPKPHFGHLFGLTLHPKCTNSKI